MQAWVKQLILIVFLAGVAEMLLPRSGMRRYAHLALGLMILLTILVPFLGFLRQDVNWDAAFAAEPAGAAHAGNEAVARGVRRLEDVGRRLTLETYREQVARRVAAVAEGVPGAGRAAARVQVDESPQSPRFGTVTGVEVLLSPGDPGRAAGMAASVEPVAPVRIGGAPAENGRNGREPADRPPAAAAHPPAAVAEAVAAALAREFGLSRQRIQVRADPGAGHSGR